MGEPDDRQNLRMTSTGLQGSGGKRAVIKLENKRTMDGDSRAAFKRSLKDPKDGLAIAQFTCEELDSIVSFDAVEVHGRWQAGTPEERLKAVEFLTARMNADHGTYYDALKAKLPDFDESRRADLQRWLRETKDTREARDAKLSVHYDVYAYFVFADLTSPSDYAGAWTHMGMGIVEKKTRMGVLVSSYGDYSDVPGPHTAMTRGYITLDQANEIVDKTGSSSRGVLEILFEDGYLTDEQRSKLYYDMSNGDPFVRGYHDTKKREVHRYDLQLPQDECQAVYENAYRVIDRFLYLSEHRCGDNAADALEASWSYLFQTYGDYPELISRNMSTADMAQSYFGSNLLASPLDVPRLTELKYKEYLEITEGRGFVKGREVWRPD